jgi:hypothetical protein
MMAPEARLPDNMPAPSGSAPHAPRTLRERLAWDADRGQVCDGPRRYMLMRPDVLMGAVAAMTPAYRVSFLEGWAASTCAHGADSLRAYAASVGGDPQALIEATTAAAADLGWGRWAMRLDAATSTLHLTVHDSPFVAGWHAATGGALAPEAVCAPIRGMLQALAMALFDAPVQVTEVACAACAPPHGTPGTAAGPCEFIARKVGP